QLDRELRRIRIGMVIVVQLLAADDDAPRRNVARGVRALEVAITPVVADAIDHTRREERYPRHLHSPYGETDGAEQHDVDDRHQRDAAALEAHVNVPLHPIVGCATTGAVARLRTTAE